MSATYTHTLIPLTTSGNRTCRLSCEIRPRSFRAHNSRHRASSFLLSQVTPASVTLRLRYLPGLLPPHPLPDPLAPLGPVAGGLAVPVGVGSLTVRPSRCGSVAASRASSLIRAGLSLAVGMGLPPRP